MKGILSIALGLGLAVACLASPVQVGDAQYFGGPALAQAPLQSLDLAAAPITAIPVGGGNMANQSADFAAGLDLGTGAAGSANPAASPRHVVLTPEPVTMTLGIASIGLFLRRRVRTAKR